MSVDFAPEVATVVKVYGHRFETANFEAFSNDMQEVLVSVSGHPKQHVGSDEFVWVPTKFVTFMC